MRSFLRTLIVFAALFLATGAAVATFVQGGQATNGGTAGASITITLSAVGNGDCVWGIAAADTGNTITATLGGVSFNVLDTITDSTNGIMSRTFILGNISGGPTSLVVNFSPNARGSAVFIEESGCFAASNPVDGAAHGGQTQVGVSGTNVITSGNFTTTTANDIIVGASTNNAGTIQQTAGSSPLAFTLRNTTTFAGGPPVVTEDGATLASPGAVAATFSDGQNQTYTTYVIAIKPTAATGSKPAFLPIVGVGGD